MSVKNIDYDRGVIKRIHPSGAEVYMYKDTPGIYLNSFGTEVTEDLAKECGMNTETYAVMRRKQEMMAKAMDTIEQEFANDQAGVKKVIKERGGFNLISIGVGRHILEDPDGNNLTPNPLTLEEGELLFEKMAPAVEKTEAKVLEEVPDIPKADKTEPKTLTAADVIAQADTKD